jgi:hypothetical protein
LSNFTSYRKESMANKLLKRNISTGIFLKSTITLSQPHKVLLAKDSWLMYEKNPLKKGFFSIGCMFDPKIMEIIIVSTPWWFVLVTIYDFPRWWTFYVHLCIHYAFCNTFIYTVFHIYTLFVFFVTSTYRRKINSFQLY